MGDWNQGRVKGTKWGSEGLVPWKNFTTTPQDCGKGFLL